ncbi:hypothetical protein HYQ46_010256 [Verticillium longisporum]|nr:hypothetical protein HYQ46_010256 [Verticillium longisporum]
MLRNVGVIFYRGDLCDDRNGKRRDQSGRRRPAFGKKRAQRSRTVASVVTVTTQELLTPNGCHSAEASGAAVETPFLLQVRQVTPSQFFADGDKDFSAAASDPMEPYSS